MGLVPFAKQVRIWFPTCVEPSAQTHDEFAAIVIGGLRRDRGMPVFAGQITPEVLQTLQAFILDQAWNAHERTLYRGVRSA